LADDGPWGHGIGILMPHRRCECHLRCVGVRLDDLPSQRKKDLMLDAGS
jgi:hypothetical protein